MELIFALSLLLAAGFVPARAAGTVWGRRLGALYAGMPPGHARYVGWGLLPQAGLAIALAYLVRQDPVLLPIRDLVLGMVIASVVINEIIGPPLVHWMIRKVGEARVPAEEPSGESPPPSAPEKVTVSEPAAVRLAAPRRTRGYVMFGVSHPERVAAATSLAVLLAHRLGAQPLAVHVAAPADFRAVGTESRVHTILQASADADLVVMASSDQTRLRKVFFGSLAEDVAWRIRRPMLVVRAGVEWGQSVGM